MTAIDPIVLKILMNMQCLKSSVNPYHLKAVPPEQSATEQQRLEQGRLEHRGILNKALDTTAPAETKYSRIAYVPKQSEQMMLISQWKCSHGFPFTNVYCVNLIDILHYLFSFLLSYTNLLLQVR